MQVKLHIMSFSNVFIVVSLLSPIIVSFVH